MDHTPPLAISLLSDFRLGRFELGFFPRCSAFMEIVALPDAVSARKPSIDQAPSGEFQRVLMEVPAAQIQDFNAAAFAMFDRTTDQRSVERIHDMALALAGGTSRRVRLRDAVREELLHTAVQNICGFSGRTERDFTPDRFDERPRSASCLLVELFELGMLVLIL